LAATLSGNALRRQFGDTPTIHSWVSGTCLANFLAVNKPPMLDTNGKLSRKLTSKLNSYPEPSLREDCASPLRAILKAHLI